MMRKWMALLGVAAVAGLLIAGVMAAENGKAIYDSKCAMCHGKDGVAKVMAKGAANFNDPKYQEANTAAAIEKVITDGKGKMPAYKDKLKPEEIKAIAEYVKTLAPAK